MNLEKLSDMESIVEEIYNIKSREPEVRLCYYLNKPDESGKALTAKNCKGYVYQDMFITEDNAFPLSLTLSQEEIDKQKSTINARIYTLLNELPRIQKSLEQKDENKN